MSQQILFFGTPEFALPSLRALLKLSEIKVLAVVTQPDKPAGRGQKLSPPPVKTFAIEQGLPVFQPSSLKGFELRNGKLEHVAGKESEFLQFLAQNPKIDACVSAAYGKILPLALIQFPRVGIINVHGSLLPRWRGAAPMQRALFAGDRETGVSLMHTELGLDTGPVYCLQEIPIEPKDTTGSLEEKLSQLGAQLLAGQLLKILNGKLRAVEQDERFVTQAAKWEKGDCNLNWQEPAEVLCRRVRASAPHPGGRANLAGELLKIFAASPRINSAFPSSNPGTIVEVNKRELIVACGSESYVALEELQLPGKRRMPVVDILRGHTFVAGQSFSEIA